MRFALGLMILTSIFCLKLFGGDALVSDPKVLEQLWNFPAEGIQSQTARSYKQGGIRVEEIYYSSRPYKRNPVRIFGYFCYPSRKGKLPAILLSHGGGGTASLERAVSWAARGYAVLAIDLPGKGENRDASRSGGPAMIVANLLKTSPDLSDNYLIHAVAAARNGITYLSRRSEVNPERIGMIGLSWGGVITLLTNGQDKRLKAAVNVFGAGFIPEGCTWDEWFASMSALDREIWNRYLDPRNFLASQNAPILFISGTNDHCYYLPTFQKSFEQVSAEKNFCLIPNLRHRFLSSSQVPALAWLDQKLKADGIFPQVILLSPMMKGEDKIVLPVEVAAETDLKSVRLYFAAGGPQQWTEKEWAEVLPYYEEGIYYFGLPTALIDPEFLFFVSARDTAGGASSSLVRSLFAVKLKNGERTYALSSPIREVFRHEKPFAFLNGTGGGNITLSFSKADNAYQIFQVPE